MEITYVQQDLHLVQEGFNQCHNPLVFSPSELVHEGLQYNFKKLNKKNFQYIDQTKKKLEFKLMELI